MSTYVLNAFGNPLYYSAESTAWFSATGSGPVLSGTTGNDSMWGDSSVNVTMVGGTGDDIYYLYSGINRAEELTGQGTDTISTWMSYALPQNIENLYVSGNDSYAFGNVLDNIIKGGAGTQTIYGGRGNDVLFGGSGADIFLIERGAGSELVADFGADDTLRIKGYGLTSFDQLQSRMVQNGDNVVVNLGNGEKLVLAGVKVEDLRADQFDLSIDKSKMTQSFFDNFTTLWLNNGTSGVWDARFPWAPESGGTLHTNGEKQWYVNPAYGPTASLNPFSVKNGVLTITAKPTPEDMKGAVGGYDYTSGVLNTHSSFAQTYGYFEMRADMPDDHGAWPAFWLLPVDGSWPPELDVVEMRGQDQHTVHTTAHSNSTGDHTLDSTAVKVPSTDGFHTYGVLWTEDELVWYFDDVAVARADTPADMHEPMYMLVNLAVGGIAGTPSSDFDDGAEMKIDYIRAFQLGPDWLL